MRIGVLGATFDPPHIAHLIASECAVDILKLESVMMIPTNMNPLKQEHQPAPPNIRLKMTEAAVGDNPKFSVSDIEIKRGGLSYMVDTIEALKNGILSNDSQIFLLMGADTALDFQLWKGHQHLRQMCSLAVFNRPGYSIEQVLERIPPPVITIEIPRMEISSSLIRQWKAHGKPIRYLVPQGVIDIIEEEQLYL